MPSRLPTVAAIILDRDQTAATLELLATLQGQDYPSVVPVVVDNGTTGATSAAVGSTYPRAHALRQTENRGCAGGRNVGIQHALQHTDAEYLFLVDNDALVEPDTICRLVEAARETPEAVLAPKILDHRSGNIWYAGADIDWRRGLCRHRGMGAPEADAPSERGPTDYASGCATFLSRQAAEAVGPVEEDYFIYYEDPDWCLRLARLGHPTIYVPEARVRHNQAPRSSPWSAFRLYYHTRNRPLFMRRWVSRARFAAFLPGYYRDVWWSALYPLWREGRRAELGAVLRGMADFRGGRFGRCEAVEG